MRVSHCFAPKYRFRILTGLVKPLVEHDIVSISQWKDVEIQEMNVQIDHVHIVCSIPPKVSVSEYFGTHKGKLAIRLFKIYPELKKKPY